MDEVWRFNRNKEVCDKKQDQELINHIKEFSKAKGRFENQVQRKVESHFYGSQYQKIEYNPKEYSIKEIRQLDRQTKNIDESSFEAQFIAEQNILQE